MNFKKANFEIITLNTNEITVHPAKTCVRSCCHEQILRTQNCRRKFIKNVLPGKRKENL